MCHAIGQACATVHTAGHAIGYSTSNQREMISRYIFDETMYRLCYSETFNVCYFRSSGRLSNRSGAAAISFGGCLVFHFRYSVMDSAMRVGYSTAYRTLVRQLLLNISLENVAYKTVLLAKK